MERATIKTCGDSPLGSSQKRHHDERQGGNGNADVACFRRLTPDKRLESVKGHVCSEQKEADAYEF
jgi:hypothetical protein